MLLLPMFRLACVSNLLGLALAILPLHDVNLLAVTDVHSWIFGGDMEAPQGANHSFMQDAGFGDLISFVSHVRAQANAVGKDVFLFDNGDIVDGTGLSNVFDDHCSALLPLYQRVPFDALNCGNHELYDNRTMEAFSDSGYIRSWNGRYLTSNLLNASTKQPLGSRYTVLHGNFSRVRLLVFGFMYNMTTADGKCDAVSVVPVAEALASDWFQSALEAEGKVADAIVVLAHMAAEEPHIVEIIHAIRQVLPAIPIHVFAGHSHKRAEISVDFRASIFEPGNFFNTLGFATFDLPVPDDAQSPVTFQLQHIDTSVQTMAALFNESPTQFPTLDGVSFAKEVNSSREALGLTKILGCMTQYYGAGPLFDLYMSDIATNFLLLPAQNASQWFLQSSGSIRYEFYPGNFTVDDVWKVMPFRDQFFMIKNLRGSSLKMLLDTLNANPPSPLLDRRGPKQQCHGSQTCLPRDQAAALPPTPLPPAYGSTNNNPRSDHVYDAIFATFDVPLVQKTLEAIVGYTVEVSPFRPDLTDTIMMMNWAGRSLGGPCQLL